MSCSSWSRLLCVSFNQKNSDESPVEILDALAGHLHQVQVRARDGVIESHWSEWSPLIQVRPWEGQKENSLNANYFLV